MSKHKKNRSNTRDHLQETERTQLRNLGMYAAQRHLPEDQLNKAENAGRKPLKDKVAHKIQHSGQKEQRHNKPE